MIESKNQKIKNPKSQNSKLKTQNSKFKTQTSKLKAEREAKVQRAALTFEKPTGGKFGILRNGKELCALSFEF